MSRFSEGGDPDATAAVRLLMWSGCRSNEILGLSWAEIDLAERVIRRKETKTGKGTILLPTAAVPVLEELRERKGDTEWVCPWWGRKTPRNDYIRRPWRRLLELAEIEDQRLHDLRHNAATVARPRGAT